MTTYRRVGESTVLREGDHYVVMAKIKHELFEQELVKFPTTRTASYDECADYADRNDSPDNDETYYVAEVVEA